MIPSLGPYHPIIVHFVIALLSVGVLFRLISLTGRAAFTGPAAATLVLLGTIAIFGAMQSGEIAHRPVEAIPGAGAAVRPHEVWADRTRNVFLGVVALEILGLLLARKGKFKVLHYASALVGLAGLVCLFETGAAGGSIVYSYAGGVGIRTGDPADVGRLLLAGMFQQAQLDRKQGNLAEAFKDFQEMQRRFPQDVNVQLLVAESLLLDQKDPAAAISALEKFAIPHDNRRLLMRHGFLMADAQAASGQKAAARTTLLELQKTLGDNPMLKQRLANLQKGPE
jgi:uncharacterized membrane protein